MQPVSGAISEVAIATKRKNNSRAAAKPKCLSWYEKIRDAPKQRHGGEREAAAAAEAEAGYPRDDTLSTLAKIFGKFGKKRTATKVPAYLLVPERQLPLPSSQSHPMSAAVGVVTTFVASSGGGGADSALTRRCDERLAPYKGAGPLSRLRDRVGNGRRPPAERSRPQSVDRNAHAQRALSDPPLREQRSNLGQPTRAQIFRDRFIRRKMLAVSSDKNDSWWRKFNVKLYYNDFYR